MTAFCLREVRAFSIGVTRGGGRLYDGDGVGSPEMTFDAFSAGQPAGHCNWRGKAVIESSSYPIVYQRCIRSKPPSLTPHGMIKYDGDGSD